MALGESRPTIQMLKFILQKPANFVAYFKALLPLKPLFDEQILLQLTRIFAMIVARLRCCDMGAYTGSPHAELLLRVLAVFDQGTIHANHICHNGKKNCDPGVMYP